MAYDVAGSRPVLAATAALFNPPLINARLFFRFRPVSPDRGRDPVV